MSVDYDKVNKAFETLAGELRENKAIPAYVHELVKVIGLMFDAQEELLSDVESDMSNRIDDLERRLDSV